MALILEYKETDLEAKGSGWSGRQLCDVARVKNHAVTHNVLHTAQANQALVWL